MPPNTEKLSEDNNGKNESSRNIRTQDLVHQYINRQNKWLIFFIALSASIISLLALAALLIKRYNIEIFLKINKYNKIEFCFQLNKKNIELFLKLNKLKLYVPSIILLSIISILIIIVVVIMCLLIFQLIKNYKLERTFDNFIEFIELNNISKIDFQSLENYLQTIKDSADDKKMPEDQLNMLEQTVKNIQTLEGVFKKMTIIEIMIIHCQEHAIPNAESKLEKLLLEGAPDILKELYDNFNNKNAERDKLSKKLYDYDKKIIKLSKEEKQTIEHNYSDLSTEIKKYKEAIEKDKFYRDNIENLFPIGRGLELQTKFIENDSLISKLRTDIANQADTLMTLYNKMAELSADRANSTTKLITDAIPSKEFKFDHIDSSTDASQHNPPP